MQDFSFDLNSKEVWFEMRFVFDYKDILTQYPTNAAATSDSFPAQAVQNSTQSTQLEIKTSESCTGNSSHLSPISEASPAPVSTAQTRALASVSSDTIASQSNIGVAATNGRKTHPAAVLSSRKTRTKNVVASGSLLPNTSRNPEPTTKHPGGRPTKRTPEITVRIAEAISFGLTDEEAAAVVRIDDDTLTQWRKIPEFSGAIKTAVAIRKLARLKRIEAGEPGWQGTAWAMERQYPERFARPEIQFKPGLCFKRVAKTRAHAVLAPRCDAFYPADRQLPA